jgi:hypothetical protein
MLTKILPEQISTYWESISFAIAQSMPPFVKTDEVYMSNILTSLLVGDLECWISTNSQGNIDAIATTQFLVDAASQLKTLLIYSAYRTSENIEDKSWIDAFQTISEYARNSGCCAIACYTTVDRIIQQALRFGGQLQTFITFNV